MLSKSHSNTHPKIFKFAYFPRYDDAIKHLAENLAQKESWDFSSSSQKKYSRLKNYLEHTYRKLKEENKIYYSENN